MKKFLYILASLLMFVACTPKAEEIKIPEGSFAATYVQTKASLNDDGRIGWAVGDQVILSNCSAEVTVTDGVMDETKGAECFTVTEDMISNDGKTIIFKPSIPAGSNYVLATSANLGSIEKIGKDGKVSIASLEQDTTFRYVASATSASGNFSLQGDVNVFSFTVVDEKIHYVEVSIGYAYFYFEVTKKPATYYFPIAVDEYVRFGAYVHAYDIKENELFDHNFTDMSFEPNKVKDFGILMDSKGYDYDLLATIMAVDPTPEATYNLEGAQLKKYLDEVQYDSDYSYTKNKQYITGGESDSVCPAKISLTGLTGVAKVYFISDRGEIQVRPMSGTSEKQIYNLIPNRIYRYGITDANDKLLKTGCFATEGRVRVIKTSTLHNFRDVGGWEGLDGKHIKYGYLIRGGEVQVNDDLTKVTDADKEILLNQAFISFDMDFRTDEAVSNTKVSPLGVEYVRYPLSAYASVVTKTERHAPYKKSILKFIENTKAGKVTYMHCQGGADRTGTIVFFIEGLLGVSESDLAKDYEITTFYYHKERNDTERYATMISELMRLYSNGGTLHDAIYNCAKKMGLTDANINELRELMLE